MSDFIGRFKIIRKLASGGMGELFVVSDPNRPHVSELVLKLLHKHLADIEEFMEMFRQEGQLVVMLEHPNIVRALEYGEVNNTPYILMLYYNGLPISKLIKRGLKLAHQEAALVLLDIAQALNYIHKLRSPEGTPLQIVHRDVNPHNILLCSDGLARLCDFGIAKSVLSQIHTRPGVFRGRFSYMAPEQLRGEKPDFRSDLYAFGIVAFELFTGKRLFESRSVEDLFANKNIAEDKIKTYEALLPTQIVALLNSLLAESKNARPDDTLFVVESVRRLVDDEKVVRDSLKAKLQHFLN